MIYKYFKLQFRMLHRHFRAFGLNPVLAWFLLAFIFGICSELLFHKLSAAAWIYFFPAISPLVLLSDCARNQFLQITFSKFDFFKIRILENLLASLPFVLYLSFKFQWLPAISLIFLATLWVFLPWSRTAARSIPTPFSKEPFEFLVGFRRGWGLIGLAYFLTIMAAWVGNFNLGVFALLLIFLTCLSFYFSPENTFYVWIFKASPAEFILGKIKNAFFHPMWLYAPVVVVLVLRFPEFWYIPLLIIILGYLYLLTILLAKYVAYPHPISVPQGVLILLALWLPPLLLLLIPYFYQRAIRNLQIFLA